MQILLFGLGDDTIHYKLKSTSIRISYLLSNQLRVAGNINDYANSEEEMQRMSLADKIKFVNELDLKLNNHDKKDFLRMEKNIRALSHAKAKSKETIVLLKQAELAFNQPFKNILQNFTNIYKEAGLIELGNLEGKPGYGCYPIFTQDTEMVHPDVGLYSDLLQMKLKEEDSTLPTSLFLNSLIFDKEFETNHNIIVPPPGQFTSSGFIFPLISFYNITVLTVAEMDALKIEINDAFGDLQQAFDRFISLKSNPHEASEYLQRELKTVAETFINRFDNSAILSNYHGQVFTAHKPLQLFAGMVPWKTIYEYFKYVKILRGKTMQVIDSITPPAEWMPVLIIKDTTEDDNIQHPPGQYEMPAMKKSLEL